REAAIRVKNEIFNILQTKPKIIILDFEGVAVVSSSFADELIAKLLLELGLFQFNNIIRLKGLDNSQQNILQRSVIQRLLEEFNHK
uniref:STAS-like domain-containing protein n=1 Tax=Bacteroides acidifaciens TaxID=85831 RepID=UPI0025A95065